jgi:cyanophycin synthetase
MNRNSVSPKIAETRFFTGPNIVSTKSGGLCSVVSEPQGTIRIDSSMGIDLLQRALSDIRGISLVLSTDAKTFAAKLIAGQSHSAAEFLAFLVDLVKNPVSLEPASSVVMASQTMTKLFIPCDHKTVFHIALGFAVSAFPVLCSDQSPSPEVRRKALAQMHQTARAEFRRFWVNQSNLALMKAAKARDIPYHLIPGTLRIVQFGDGVFRKRIFETGTENTGLIANRVAHNKLMTSQLFAALGLPTATSTMVSSLERACAAAVQLGYPVVLKPQFGQKGSGVQVNIRTEQDLIQAIKTAPAFSSGMLLERHIDGGDFRLLIVDGRFVAAAQRVPAHVVGDGRSTIKTLVEEANRDPRRGMRFELLMEQIVLDEEALRLLKQAQLAPDRVPDKGYVVQLRGAANISLGGSANDVTGIIHPDNIAMAERAARLVGLDVTGIDFITPDITKSWREVPSAILELNATPGLRSHLMGNPEQDVAGTIIEALFPDPDKARVPTIGITGSIGKTTTCRMVARILKDAGRTVALSTTKGAWVGDFRLRDDDVAGGRMAKMLLLDPTVDAGVFELARGGLIRNGLCLDSLSVGVVLNVGDNHVGLDGVKTRDQMAAVKSLVARSARDLAVLNADDPLCIKMRRSVVARKTYLVSTRDDSPEMIRHLEADGTGVFLSYDVDQGAPSITLRQGDHVIGAIPGAEIPASLGGEFLPPIINAAFAVAITHGLGTAFEDIWKSLAGFQSTQD